MIQQELRRIYNRLKMMIGVGEAQGFSDAGSIQKAKYKTALELSSGTPRMIEFGFSSGLPSGTDVLLVSLSGDRSDAIIIASNNASYRHKNLKPGETVIYNQWGQFIKLTEDGITIEANNKPVTVNQATTVTINATEGVKMVTPKLEVTGEIVDMTDASNNQSLNELRTKFEEHKHVVQHVQSGDASITSNVPNNLDG